MGKRSGKLRKGAASGASGAKRRLCRDEAERADSSINFIAEQIQS